MEHRRPSLIGPLILITFGVLLLLSNLGYLPLSIWQIAAQYWPIILILIGIEILFGRRSWIGGLVVLALWIAVIAGIVWLAMSGSALLPLSAMVSEQLSEPLGDIKSATIDLNAGASIVFVTASSSDTSDLMSGKFSHREGIKITKTYNVTDSNGRLVLKEEGNPAMFIGASNGRWDVALYPQIPLTLRVNSGIGTVNLDLSALNVTMLDVNGGVGSLIVTTPQAGATTMKINGGVGNVVVTIPAGVAARIRVDSGLGGVNVDQTRFIKSDKIYQSADYASATNKIDIDVNGGVGSVTIR
ncbi:MAG: hypothetical protein HY868_18965 [Chloroflexi bacterium]|nr:hypothetical protein [Chloroflexota bacterium]